MGRTLLIGVLALALAGCETGEFGFSVRNAELSRVGGFSVVSASSERAVVGALGQQVAIEPPPGFCLDEGSIETSDRSAFVLIGDCLMDGGAGLPSPGGGSLLPGGMPGIMTVSISGDPGFSGGGNYLAELEGFLAGAEGRVLLGRGGDGSQVSVVDTRRQGDILYVLVEDRAAGAVPLLAPRFWRAFLELNDRLAVVTVSGFRDVPMEENEMLRYLGDQVRQLQVANAAPIGAPVRLAAAPSRERSPDAGSGDAPPVDTSPGGQVPVEPALVDAQMAGAGAAEANDDDPWGQLAADAPGNEAENGLKAPRIAEAGAAEESVEMSWRVAGTGELAAADGKSEPTWAAGGPEPMHSWAQPADEAAAVEPWAIGDAAVGPVPRPMVVGASEAGQQGLWPMPAARPGAGAAPVRSSPAAPETGAGAPMPLPRLVDAADRVARTSRAAVPLPPRRVLR